MLRKIIFSVMGFGLGLFMLFNSVVVFSKFIKGAAWELTSQEKLFSIVISCLVGLVLVIWTYLLVKKSGNRSTQ